MSGVTLSDLSKYHQGAMKWFKDGLVSEHNRLFAQTEEAGAVSFWPLGGTPLEGKVKFSFKETPPASGDKGPENPSTIIGVSSIDVIKCGKNLVPYPYTHDTRTINGVSYTVNEDGSVLVNGTASAASVFYFNNNVKKTIYYPGVTYIISGKGSNEITNCRFGVDLYSYESSPSYKNTYVNNNSTQGSFTVNTRMYGRQYIKVDSGYSPQNLLFYPQIEISSTKTDYEKPIYDKLNIPLGSTYYGGEIDLATGLMTVTHVGFQPSRTYLQTSDVVVTGTQNLWQIFLGKIKTRPANTFNYSESAGYGGPDFRCNYFQWDRTGNTKSFHTSGGFVYASFEGATAEEARQNCLNLYDAAVANNNPLTIVYPLATPFTVQLTPLQLTALTQKDKYTPRMNTVYTDADSIQITYRKSLIHDEDEKVQAIVALGGNV